MGREAWLGLGEGWLEIGGGRQRPSTAGNQTSGSRASSLRQVCRLPGSQPFLPPSIRTKEKKLHCIGSLANRALFSSHWATAASLPFYLFFGFTLYLL